MDATIVLQGQDIPFVLEHSRRRSVGLTVSAERGLVVRCPMRMSRRAVDGAIRSKARWVLAKLADARAERDRCAPVRWQDGLWLPLVNGPVQLKVLHQHTPMPARGSAISRLGDRLEVRLSTAPAAGSAPLDAAGPASHPVTGTLPTAPQQPAPSGAQMDSTDRRGGTAQGPLSGAIQLGFDFIQRAFAEEQPAAQPARSKGVTVASSPAGSPTATESALREQVLPWLREEARNVLSARCDVYRHALDLPPVRLRIKDSRSRWGSCSALGNLNFSWRLVLAPAPVLDYVVVHELCHRIHLNHSPDYWRLVQAILPDFAERRAWLRHEGATLHRW